MAETVLAGDTSTTVAPRLLAAELARSSSGIPSLWTALAVACAALCLLALVAEGHHRRRSRHRCRAVLPGHPRPGVGRAGTGSPATPHQRPPERGGVRRLAIPAHPARHPGDGTAGAAPRRPPGAAATRVGALAPGVGLAVSLLVGGTTGVLLGALAAAGAWQVTRRAARDQHPETVARREAVARLPLAAELLAACLAAGSSPHEAAGAVGGALGGPLGERLNRVAAEARLGAEPTVAWRHVGQLPGAERLARRMALAASSGVPAEEAISHLAAESRARQARDGRARAQKAGVLATAPLGLCFLPAFLLLGVAPTLLGLADALW